MVRYTQIPFDIVAWHNVRCALKECPNNEYTDGAVVSSEEDEV